MGGCLKRTPVCCSIRLRKSGGDIKSLSMRSTGTRSGTEYMQTDRPRFVILLFTIWSTFGLLMNALGTEVELQNNPNKVIAMSKAAGLDFLNF